MNQNSMQNLQLIPYAELKPSEAREFPREADSARDFVRVVAESQSLASNQVWICLHFPELSLNVFEQTDKPLAVAERQGSRHVLCAVNSSAEEFGVAVGMPVNAAYTLCRELEIRLRDEAAEHERLLKLAEWIGQFTPSVNIRSPNALLLEVSGSLKLFGGLDKLRGRILTALQKRLSTVSAVAPAPLAAWLLASNGLCSVVSDKAALKSALGDISLCGLGLPGKLSSRVAKIGVRNLRDLWRLPRDGLARRFDQQLIDFLDKASGAKPDPQTFFLPQARYQNGLEMPLPSDDAALLATACEKLLQSALAFLRSHDSGTSELLFNLHHEGKPDSILSINLQQPGRDLQRFMRLLRERLDRFELAELVIGVTLNIARPETFVAQATDLFDNKQALQNDWQEVVESIQSRLGKEAIYGLALAQDHRPERAYKHVEPQILKESFSAFETIERPLWLLKTPEPINLSALTILSTPERVESGWWDGADVRRTYYVAQTQSYERWWVFHDTDENVWYHHGVF